MSAKGLLGVLVTLLLGGGAVFAWVRAEGDAPTLVAPEAMLVGRNGAHLELEIDDTGAGLRAIRVDLVHAGGETSLVDELYPGDLISGAASVQPRRIELDIDPDQAGSKSGDAVLRVTARDWSWRDVFRGNEATFDLPVTVDLDPPRVNVASGLTYIRRGGSGVVAYTVSEATVRDGVRVGDAFYHGAPMPGDGNGSLPSHRVALFAVPTDAPEDPAIRVVAEDRAGNESLARWPVVVKERSMPRANVTLPPSFFEHKVAQLAAEQDIDATDPVAAFQEINTRLRSENEQRIRAAIADSAPERFWNGRFEQLPNSKVTSRFAEQRHYFVRAKQVSKATHFGYDLASTAAAPILAANAGRVIFSEELGIYGNCVLIDHGLGLVSLYGHLSRMDVAAGDRVDKGQVLGLSGATGLAGGDHLHFAILVGQTYVDPIEWWDPEWVRTHVEARLAPSTP